MIATVIATINATRPISHGSLLPSLPGENSVRCGVLNGLVVSVIALCSILDKVDIVTAVLDQGR
jgi:hypothetical protein